MIKPRILLHICCAPDSTSVFEKLDPSFEVTGFFSNPNIHPFIEYRKRLEEVERVSQKMGFRLVVPPYNPDSWLKRVKGLEDEPEGGKRCEVCLHYNLHATAKSAHEKKFSFFTTTLTVSPHKNSQKIFEIARKVALEFDVIFLKIDFKKKNGFRRSLALSKKFNLYRQNYCGCKYSIRCKSHS